MATGYKFLDGVVQKDFADVFDITYPVPGVSTGYYSNLTPYFGKDLGKIFTAGTGSGKTTHYNYLTNIDLGSIFALKNSKVWYALGIGCDEFVNAVAIDSLDNVYAGGFFTSAGGDSAYRIAKYAPSTNEWTPLGDGLVISGSNADVFAIAIDSLNNVYAGGYFTSAGGAPANYIAIWNGSTWATLGIGTSGTVFAIAIDSLGNVYVGGEFTSAGGAPANYIAKYAPSTNIWTPLGTGTNGTNAIVHAIAIDSLDNVYVGGDFTSAGGNPAYRIAIWDAINSTWTPLGSGTNSAVRSIAIDSSNNYVYVGGDFTSAGGASANHIAIWNGSTWTTLGTGTNNVVRSIAINSSNNYVYAGGDFTSAGGASANRIANWDAINSTWTTLGTGLDISGSHCSANSIAIDSSNNVYVGGLFTSAGGTPANYIAKYA